MSLGNFRIRFSAARGLLQVMHQGRPNKRMKFVRCAHPTRNGEAPLLAAYARRWAGDVAKRIWAGD
jgi:hypothetical protein